MLQNNIREMTANVSGACRILRKAGKNWCRSIPSHNPELRQAYRRLCRRWVSPSVAGAASRDRDARMAGAFLAMPLMLAVAMITSHSMLGELARCCQPGGRRSGASDDFLRCAFALEETAQSVGMSALGAYGLSIAAIGATAPSANLLLWIMAAAIPLEAWFVYRTEKSIRVSAGIAAVVLATLLIVCAACGWQRDAVAAGAAGLVRLSGDIDRQGPPSALAAHAMAARRDDRVADLESAVEGVVFSLGTDGLIVSLSSKAQDQFGIARNLLIGTPLLDRVHVSDRVQFLGFLADMKNGAPSAMVEAQTALRCAGRDIETRP